LNINKMAFNNNYTAIIQNAQQTVNTGVQASQLNGGNIAQIFNLQAMRTVKGRALLTTTNATGTSLLINEYDGSPVNLGPSDFIVAYAVSNGNGPATGALGPVFVPTQFTGTGTIDIQPASCPSYSTQTGIWTPGTSSGFSICATGPLNPTTLTPAGVYPAGYTSGSITSTCTGINRNYGGLVATSSTTAAMGAYQWINIINGGGFSTAGYINVTLLVLSGFPGQ
jgi:hypothetical protein